ncbi:MAG: hypothetical protein AD742_02620 [Methylibium sp. NZG]|nr:MAG: hypothetical protein AD742_02620 [Methylibium sp. NZG]
MKVLNLRCAHDHRFEGWFDSEDDFQSQHERGLVECPLCADKAVTRLPSAPRLNVSNLRDDAKPARSPGEATEAALRQSKWMQTVRHLMDNTEDVGERFPEEARRIHYGEAQERGIRGQASREDAEALREEGIEVTAVPVPAALKGPVQ